MRNQRFGDDDRRRAGVNDPGGAGRLGAHVASRDPRWRPVKNRYLWWLLGLALVLWAGSWRVIYLEVTRWHHMDTRLRFTPPTGPSRDMAPHPGLPVIAAVVTAYAAPLLTVAIAVLLVVRTRRQAGLADADLGEVRRVLLQAPNRRWRPAKLRSARRKSISRNAGK